MRVIRSTFLLFVFLFISGVVSANNYYWVGKNSTWSDAENWSTSSGGKGGAGIPTLADNVFFDDNSFHKRTNSITISNSAKCNNFIYTSSKKTDLLGNTSTSLHVNGSYLTNDNINNLFYGKTIFSNNTSATINTYRSFVFLGDIAFEGHGKWNITSDLILTDSNYIYLNKGELLIENRTIYTGGLICKSANVSLNAKKAVIYAHNKWIIPNGVTFNTIETDIIINSKASKENIITGNHNYSSLIYGQNTRLTNTCGTIPFTVTATVYSNYNGYSVSCFGVCDGKARVSITGGVGPFVIDWVGYGGLNDPDSIIVACQGNLGVSVTDQGQNPPFGVQCTDQVLITNPIALTVNLQGTVNPTCYGDCDGAIGTSINFGVTPYTITWTPGNMSTPTISNLCDGTYNLNVVDANGCTIDTAFSVSEPPEVTFDVDSFDVSCFGDCDGRGVVSNEAGGAGAPYTYSWNDPLNQNTPIANNLCTGSYIVTVTDGTGCFGQDTITINTPPQMVLDSQSTNVSCGGACDGTVTATVLSGGIPPFSHSWSNGATATGASSTLSSLCPGTYTDTITDANGCDTTITFNITEPTPLITSSTPYDVTCNGNCNGSIKTNPSGGSAPYSYLWSPGNPSGQGTDSIFNLCPGQYIVTITDVNNCSVNDTINITEPLVLSPNISGTNMSCNGVCDGSATANPTGGVTPYSYNWSPGGQTSQTINSLCAGTYIVTVTDSNGCVAVDSIIINEPFPINISLNPTDMSCNGVCDGTIGSSVNGGTPPYNYTWAPGGQTTDSIFGLCGGNYTLTVTDANGCSANLSTTVNEPAPINIITTQSNVSCNGVCDGSATALPAGGTAPYTISWNTIPVQNGVTASNLCAGTYVVTVTDANGCSNTAQVIITEPAQLTTNTSTNNVSCFGVCDGSATTTPSGGIAPYSYSWNTIPVQTTPTASNLCVGTYIVTISDSGNVCSVTDTIIISGPDSINPNVQYTNMSCNGICDGSALALPLGGNPPYNFSWAPGGQTTQGINNLCAGTYTVTITDASGCSNQQSVTIVDPPALTTNSNVISASCGSVCDGSATTNPSGGTTPYTYNWIPSGQTTQTATNLCAGTYIVTVTDSSGCSVSDSVTVGNLIVINVVTDTITVSCNGACDGQATANPSGGQAPYSYNWSPGGQNTQTATGLCPGTYTVTVTDANGCVSSAQVTIPVDPSVLVPNGSVTNVSCFGLCDGTAQAAPSGGTTPYSVLWTPSGDTTLTQSNLCAGTYTVTVTDANGCAETDTLIITEPDSISLNETIVDVDCNGNCNGSISLNPSGGAGAPYAYLWSPGGQTSSSISNQCAGNYTVTVTDANGCSKQKTFIINEPNNLTSNPTQTNVSCNGACDGSAAVNASGGTAPYSYFWSPGGQTTSSISNLCPGTYIVTITDSLGCITNQSITITEPNILNANVSGSSESCNGNCDGTATANSIGGTTPYTYLWSPGGQTTSSLSNLCPGTYSVTVTDSLGCVSNGSYTVTSPTVLTVTLDSTDALCSGVCDGTATANPIGGSAPYTYNWVPSGQTTQTATGLCAGVHTVTVTDTNGCFFIGSIVVNAPQVLDDNETVTNANCGACDGVISTNPSGGTPPYSHSWSNGATTATITNLCPGNYTDTITDFNGCTQFFTISVSTPTGPSGVTQTVVDANCNGACDGAINVIPIGGQAPYTYLWTPGGMTDSTITGLCSGAYSLTVTDANGCPFNTIINVGEADSITANASFTNTNCNGSCDGTASVNPTGGTPPYSFNWSTGGSNSSVSGLCVGPVSVTITDANSCVKLVTFNITSPNALTLNTSAIDATCNSTCDGSATVIPSNGTAPYTYQWNDPLSQTTQTASGLCAGTYSVTVTDANGCSDTAQVVINEPNIIDDNETITDATCGVCDGAITINPTGGTAPYTYLWSNGFTSSTVSGLCAGTYSVTVTDSNGCSETFLIPVSNTTGPDITINNNNASCNGACDGSANVIVNSGTAPFSYLWSPGGQTTSSIAGLCAGNYTVQVTDANGCLNVQAFNITENNLLTATIVTTDANCNGVCDGTAVVTPSGGIPPYSYNWSTGHTINAVGGLCAGTHSVTVTDANGCSSAFNVVIAEPNNINVAVNTIDANCNGSCDGQAIANPSGGTAPYSYLWSNGATTSTINGLCAGAYSVTVTDANGCSGTTTFNIGQSINITANIVTQNATCGQCDGYALVNNITGGGGLPYTYLWLPGGQTTDSIGNLCPGAYTLQVTDNNGCNQSFNVLINNANGPSLTTQGDSVTCNGDCDGIAWTNVTAGTPNYIYQWDDPSLQANDSATSLCAGLYNVVVQDANGCISVDSITIHEPPLILGNLTFTPESCPGTCDATATAAPTNTVGNVIYLWQPSGQNTATAIGLCAGTHTVTITDANGCSVIDSIVITSPSTISITASATSPTCNGACDATALATPSGGVPPYTYLWNDPNSQTNSLATGLCPGNYTVTVTDINGCSQIQPVTVPNPLVLSTASTTTPASCNGACDGTATTNPTGGSSPYTFVWSNGQTTQTASNLCVGTYYVTVIDSNNCSVNDTVQITQPSTIVDNTVINNPSCGLCDGDATANPTGGSGFYTYLWGDGQTTQTAVGLCAGTITLQITDTVTGCSDNFTILLNNSNGPTLNTSSTDETCTLACDGSATTVASGGTTPYTYSWNTVPVQNTATANNLCVGTYTITVTDSNNCITVDTVTINTNGLNLSVPNVTDATCFGSCDGNATVAANSGMTPYTYLWNPTNQNTSTAINLCAGNYIIIVTDNLGCTDSITATVSEPDLLQVNALINTPISCNSSCDGILNAIAIGGTSPYSFQWNTLPPQNNALINNICAGTYIVTVTDANGCTAIDTVTLTEPSIILANETLVLPNCGLCDGSISLNPSGGSGPYTFNWIPGGQNTGALINLCAGSYIVEITDANGCMNSFTFALSNSTGPTLTLNNNDVSCYGLCDGSATVNATGSSPFTYFWTPGGQTNSTANNLCAGVYSVEVTDVNGCVTVMIDSISEPDELLANISSMDVSCAGSCDGWAASNPIGGTAPFNYNWTPTGSTLDSISNLCIGLYNVTVTDANGCVVTDSVNITTPNPLSVTTTGNDATCSTVCDGSATATPNGGSAPYSYSWSPSGQLSMSVTNLCVGTHYVTVTDANGCSITDSVVINSVDSVLADAGPDTIVCLGGSVNLIGTSNNGTSVEWFELPSMISLGTSDTLPLNPSSIGTFCYLYTVYGQCNAYDTVCVTVEALPNVDAGDDVSILEGSSTTLGASGGSGYNWTPSSGLSDTTIANPVASPSETTTYYVTVTSPGGCVGIDSVTVYVIPQINFPNGITPNGDGKNDTWVIDFIDQYPDAVVEIYNRWGQLLFQTTNYQNDWDGTYKGEELPIGTYYYIIDLNEEGAENYTGPLTVVR